MANVNLGFPDSGPLISLAKANLLDSILVFKPSTRIIITDSVQIEICGLKENCSNARRASGWIEENRKNKNIEIGGVRWNRRKFRAAACHSSGWAIPHPDVRYRQNRV